MKKINQEKLADIVNCMIADDHPFSRDPTEICVGKFIDKLGRLKNVKIVISRECENRPVDDHLNCLSEVNNEVN